MLILIVRIWFVVLLSLAANQGGKYFFGPLHEAKLPWWFPMALGFGVAVTLIAAEQAFRRHFTRSLVALLVGLGGGAALACLLLVLMRMIVQDDQMYRNLDLPLALLVLYLVMITVLRNVDRLRVVVPFVEFRSEQASGGTIVLDGALLTDGRLTGLLRSGLLGDRLLVHRRVLRHFEEESRQTEPVRQARGIRALQQLDEVRRLGRPTLEVDETEVPNAIDLDDLLVRLTRLENGRLLTASSGLARRAGAEGVPVVDVAMLAGALVSILRTGDTLSVLIEKPGEAKDQGIGHLDDGSLVVVTGAGDDLGQTVTATVLRIHQSANGRMVFAQK